RRRGAGRLSAAARAGTPFRYRPGARFSATPSVRHLLSFAPPRKSEAQLMSWSVNIGSIAGTAVRIHVTFILFLAFFFLVGLASGSVLDGLNTVAFVVLLFACVLAHEFGHIFTARAFGVPTPDVTLLPIGGVARLARIPENPVQELLIAIAGPLVNVAI